MEKSGDVAPCEDGITSHPTLAVIGLIVLVSFVLLKFIPHSPAASPGFIIMLFLLGVYPVVSVARGFASVFGRSFFALPASGKLRVMLLAIALTIPSLGIAAFIRIFVSELSIQLHCSGAGCAQGGIGMIGYLPIAWVSYALVLASSLSFTQEGWWPPTITPRFGPAEWSRGTK